MDGRYHIDTGPVLSLPRVTSTQELGPSAELAVHEETPSRDGTDTVDGH
jgi:hypothetical protein